VIKEPRFLALGIDLVRYCTVDWLQVARASRCDSCSSVPGMAASPAGSFWAKPEWAPFFREALAAEGYEDCSTAPQAPPWADAAATAAGGDDGPSTAGTKPLWLALRHPGSTRHTRASLDTFEKLDDKLVLAKALTAAGADRTCAATADVRA